MIRPILLLLALVVALPAVAQQKLFVGVEAGLARGVYEGMPAAGLRISGEVLPIIGPTLSWQINDRFTIQAAALRKPYAFIEGPERPYVVIGTVVDAFEAWLVPMRLQTRHNLLRHKIFFVTASGAAIGKNTAVGFRRYDGFSVTSYNDANVPSDTLSLSTTIHPRLRNTFGLLQTGAGLEFLIRRTVPLRFDVNYYTGLHRVAKAEIESSLNGHESSFTVYSKGSFWNVGLSVAYPVSTLWRKRQDAKL